MTPPHPDWIVPNWPAPPHVRALMSTATGGLSQGLFSSMNLGDHVGDEARTVAANRGQLARVLGRRPVFMRQVHGCSVAQLSVDSPDGLAADGAISTHPGLACVVMVADCLPILLAHEQQPVVAALHAGWRGLAGQGGQGIVEAGWQALCGPSVAGSEASAKAWASGLMAWLGPCIGPQAFEVGAEVRQAFMQVHAQAADHFVPLGSGKFLADLPALARLRLSQLGVTRVYGNDGSPAWCTVSQSRFFSHRRVSGRAGARPGDTGGRMAACIWLA